MDSPAIAIDMAKLLGLRAAKRLCIELELSVPLSVFFARREDRESQAVSILNTKTAYEKEKVNLNIEMKQLSSWFPLVDWYEKENEPVEALKESADKHLVYVRKKITDIPVKENVVGVFMTFQNDVRYYEDLLARLRREVSNGNMLRVSFVGNDFTPLLPIRTELPAKKEFVAALTEMGAEWVDVSMSCSLFLSRKAQGEGVDGLGFSSLLRWREENPPFELEASKQNNLETELISRLVYGVPHALDIYSPMSTISGLSQVARIHGDFDIEAHKDVKIVKVLRKFMLEMGWGRISKPMKFKKQPFKRMLPRTGADMMQDVTTIKTLI